MPTIVTHAFVATLLGKSIAVGRMPARFWILSAVFSVLPDIDVLGFPLGIRYEDMLGHRGLSHSLFFAFVLSWIVAFLTFPRLPERWTRFLLFSYFFAVTASHGALDAMTDGGLGIAFFAPFDNTRYFFPFRPIKVSPIGLSFFSARGLDVIWSELLWVCIPATMIAGAVLFYRKLRRPHASLGVDH
jgi:inner membrane protein